MTKASIAKKVSAKAVGCLGCTSQMGGGSGNGSPTARHRSSSCYLRQPDEEKTRGALAGWRFTIAINAIW